VVAMNLQVNGFNIWLILLVTFLTSLILSFICKKVAVHINALDIPNERKIHKKPTPRIGGLAIYGAFLLGYMIYGVADDPRMISVLIGGFIIILTGLIDDIKPIKARWKFLLQIIAASVVVIYGQMYFSDITLLGLTLKFPYYINMILSIFFIVSVINVINLIDGLDGLSSGICSIYFLTIAIIGFVLHKFGGLDIIISLIMLGATLGFLVHNFPPARIFMGDTGSMFLGFMIAIIALIGYKVATVTSIIIPVLLLFIPIIDTLFAIIRRLLKKESIATPDKEHLHHQLLRMTSSPTKTVLLIYFINIIFSAISIFFALNDDKIAIIMYAIVMLFFIFLVLKTDILFTHKKKKDKEKK
jgi:UDP-GlcNAc:undecaprenyl-phosphate GlcNAc-1-phosphate transferase